MQMPNKGKNVPIVGRKTEFALMVAVFIVVKALMLFYGARTLINQVTAWLTLITQTRTSKKK